MPRRRLRPTNQLLPQPDTDDLASHSRRQLRQLRLHGRLLCPDLQLHRRQLRRPRLARISRRMQRAIQFIFECTLGIQWQWHLTIKTGPFEIVQNVNDSTSTCVPFVQTYSGLNIFTFTDACTGSVSATVTI
jgi:hypothetical protein